ncbi:hypothetical protein, partial [Paracraurococcus ruber]
MSLAAHLPALPVRPRLLPALLASMALLLGVKLQTLLFGAPGPAPGLALVAPAQAGGTPAGGTPAGNAPSGNAPAR